MRDIQNAANGLHAELGEFEDRGIPEYSEQSESESPFDEAQEMELAVDLLEVTDEAGLDHFVYNLVHNANQSVGSLLSPPTGRSLIEALKRAALKTLPHVGRTVGGTTGSQTDASLASQAARAFGLELEGLSPEDQEFELARSYVRFAGNAAKRAATIRAASPRERGRNAFLAAARQHAPGLIDTRPNRIPPIGLRNNGRWVRHGRTIVIDNA